MSLSNTRVRFGRHSTMVLIPVYDLFCFRLQVSSPQTPTHEKRVDGHASSMILYFSSSWLRHNFCSVVALDPSMLPTSLVHCLDTLSNYGSGRESCTDKVFSPRLGVFPGSFFNAVHRGTLPLANVGRPNPFFKVGIVFLQIGLQIGLQMHHKR